MFDRKFRSLVVAILVAAFAIVGVGMAAQTVFPTDVVVHGNFAATSMTLANGSVADSQVAAAAGISAGKLQHAHVATYAQGSSTNATSATQVFYVAVGSSGNVVQLAEAGAIVPATGADTCTIDIKKGGTSILSSVITLSSSQSARQLVLGTVTTANYSAGDVFEVVVTPNHSSGTLPQGVFVALDVFEAAQ